MKRFICSLLVATLTSLASAADEERAKPFLVVPSLTPAPELSGAMKALLASLKEEEVLDQVDQWKRLTELPDWVFDPQKRELGVIPPRPLFVHDFRYAVVVSTSGEVIIVRAGGLSDTYEFFTRPNPEPNQPVQHNAGSRPSSGDSPASATPSAPAPRG